MKKQTTKKLLCVQTQVRSGFGGSIVNNMMNQRICEQSCNSKGLAEKSEDWNACVKGCGGNPSLGGLTSPLKGWKLRS